uniref:heparin/heparin-sulfate lyase HepB n=1 Tax=Pedobacter schmidteae TaxID=2201271 RepID=UPI000EB58F90|nr:heparin/heparin-sulfate lyase HepB [Pedobacter schmidteae]
MKRQLYLCLIFFVAELVAFTTKGHAQMQNDVIWKEVDGVSMPIPPRAHPRLYLREKQVPDLKNRMNDPELKKVWADMIKMQEDWKPEDIPEVKDFRFYFNQKGLTVRVELMALNYLMTKDPKLGRKAITSIIDTLETATFKPAGDISRGIGLFMVTGAIVYDWCYDQLKPEEKSRFVKAFVRLAKMLECGYPPEKDKSIVGHASEWMIMRDLLSVGIAIYDEFPEMYNLAAGRFFKEHLVARNWFYPSHNYHQGMSYLNVRFTNDLFALWILDRMGAGNVFHPGQQFVLYDMIYKRRPDGQIMAGGDVDYSRKKPKYYSLPTLLAGSYYKDEYLNYEFLKDPKVEAHCKLFEFLWRDTKLGSRKPDDLPLSRYSGSPFGWMIARTGWGPESVIAEMKINEYSFLNHQHQDAGAFQIYYKGPLAIDAGSYTGSSGGYNSPHNKNFFKRTIAHNSLLIYDPKETFSSSGYGGSDHTDFAANDGGQRLPGKGWTAPRELKEMLAGDFKTGKIIAQGFGPDAQTPDYTYLKGDITEAYSAKVKEVKRSFLFLNLKDAKVPAAMIVFDKVVSAKPDFKKFWLLHSIEKPEIKGNQMTIKRTKNGDSGMLVNTALLPDMANADITAVGGKGKDFWVFGTNYTNDPKPGTDEALERGEWRIEITPKKVALEDYYLNVMQIADNTQQKLHEVKRIDGDKVVGVQLADRVVTFSRTSETVDRTFNFSVSGKGIFKFVITDLLPGTWQVWKDGKVLYPALSAGGDDAALHFTGTEGTYRFLR